jgi:heptosyltransferase-3
MIKLGDVRSIGVFKIRNIGDVLMITPALRALRECCPDAKITVIVNSFAAPMLENNPHIDLVLVYDRSFRKRPWAGFLHEWRIAREIRKARFDLTVSYTFGERSARYCWLSGARNRVAFKQWNWNKWSWQSHAYTDLLPVPAEPLHEVEKHLWLLEQFGIRSKDKSLCLLTGPEADQWAEQLVAPYKPGKVVHIHPMARWLFKCWDDAKMAAVIDWLELEIKAKVFVTADGEGDEVARVGAIMSHCKSSPVILAGKTTLAQLAALSRQADCFLGVDTAPMHIAAAVGTPVVALFGPTGVESWRPWCARQITLHKPCPCNQLKKQVCDWSGVRDCMQAITVAEVKAALETFL